MTSRLTIQSIVVCSEEALREAKRCCDKLKEMEESLVPLEELERMHSEGNEMISCDRLKQAEEWNNLSNKVERIGELCAHPLI